MVGNANQAQESSEVEKTTVESNTAQTDATFDEVAEELAAVFWEKVKNDALK